MLDRLKALKQRYEELGAALSAPDAMSDQNRWRDMVKEHAQLQEIVAAYDAYLETAEGIADCKAMLADGLDPEMKDLVHQELSDLTQKQEELEESWDAGTRYFYAVAFAEGFRSVGRPAIAVQWLRGESEDGGPTLMVGGTLAWTVLDTATGTEAPIELQRRRYERTTVFSQVPEGSATGYIQITSFADSTADELEAAVDTLAEAGVLTATDYWKGDAYSSGNVHALIKSMAAYVRGK